MNKQNLKLLKDQTSSNQPKLNQEQKKKVKQVSNWKIMFMKNIDFHQAKFFVIGADF